MNAHARLQVSSIAVPPVWEVESGVSGVHSDNGWLLSFIDILALLLTLFVLLLAYEADGPDTTATSAPVLQPTQAQPDAAAAQESPNPPALLQPLQPAPLVAALPFAPALAAPASRSTVPAVIDLPFTAPVMPDDRVAAPLPDSATAPPGTQAQQAQTAPPADSAQPVERQAAMPQAPAEAPAPSVPPAAEAAPAAPVEMPRDATPATPQETLLAAFADSGLQERLDVTVHSGVVNIEVSDRILFMPASAALTADGAGLLAELAAVLAELPFRLSVEGHTDNIPIQTARFPSNWELSSARAAIVTRELIGRGVAPDRIRAIGYGDTRPLADNDTPEGRAKNRRVSFVLQAPSREPPAGAEPAVPRG